MVAMDAAQKELAAHLEGKRSDLVPGMRLVISAELQVDAFGSLEAAESWASSADVSVIRLDDGALQLLRKARLN